MARMLGCLICLMSLAGAAPLPVSARVQDTSPTAVLDTYVAAILNDRLDDACALWHPDYLAESAALNISYSDVAAPWDLASPLFRALSDLRAGRLQAATEVLPDVGKDDTTALLTLRLYTDDLEIRHRYAAVRTGGTWRLAGPSWAVGRRWPIGETEYFHLHHLPGLTPTSAARRELDLFVTRNAAALGLSDADLARLRRVKIPYYLGDEAALERLTGYPTKGMVDLAGSAVISSHFPHFHELVHLLVNISLGETELYTLPLLQEGVACLLGGRWGRAPATILYTAWVNRHFGMDSLESILTQQGFHAAGGGPDTAYPLAAALCEFVRREGGWPAVWSLYRQVSGSAVAVAGLGADHVSALISAACGFETDTSTVSLAQGIDAVCNAHRRCGVEPAGRPRSDAPAHLLGTAGDTVSVRRDGDFWTVQVRSDAKPAYVLSAADPEPPHVETGSLFREHLPQRAYRGERYGLRCDPDNISLYDFAANQLVATWVAGFTDEAGACDTPAGGLRFTILAAAYPGFANAFRSPTLVVP